MRDRGPFGRKAKPLAGLPPKTDLVALSSDIRRLGPKFALPNKMPQKWLLSIGRDLIISRVLEQDQSPGSEDPGLRLQSAMIMIMTILGEQRCPGDAPLKAIDSAFTEKQICEFVDIYQYLVFEELAARAAGVKAVSYDLASIF